MAKVCCYECVKDKTCDRTGLPLGLVAFIACSWCGNKRCPHATDHRNDCTGSNEPGQKGSRYE